MEEGTQSLGIDDASTNQRLHIRAVTLVPALDLGQGLRVGIEVVDGELSELLDELTPILTIS